MQDTLQAVLKITNMPHFIHPAVTNHDL